MIVSLELPLCHPKHKKKILTGALMIALLDHRMDAAEVRWASVLASAMRLPTQRVEECCLGARILTDMLHPVTRTS